MMNYREIIKKTCMALAVGIITFSSVSSVNAATFTTTGGQYNKSWNATLSVTKPGGTIYRLTGNANQPQNYKFDNVSITVTQYCNGSNNAIRTVSGTRAYSLSTFADAATNIANGKGTMLLTVSDSTYGKGSWRIYN